MRKNFSIDLILWLVVFNVVGVQSQYFSRCGQDKFLNEEIFKNKINGVFVDIGAYDGIVENNTCFFEKKLGWTGVCVEPLGAVYKKLAQNRTCTCIAGVVAAQNGRREFVEVYGRMPYMSGFVNTYYVQNWKIINLEDLHGGGWRIIMVPTCTFGELCTKNGLTHIDYVSLSTMGSEEEIIRSIDFVSVDITAISVENQYDKKTIQPYLESKGYQLMKRLGTVDIYLKS